MVKPQLQPSDRPNLPVEANIKNVLCSKPKETAPRRNIVELDINRIADRYVLEGGLLRKYQSYEDAVKKSNPQKNAQNTGKENSDMQERKEIFKLEYLEKMGFLRPEEKQKLAQYRKDHPEHKPAENLPKQQPLSQSVAVGYEDVQYYSPRGHESKISQYYSPGKRAQPVHGFWTDMHSFSLYSFHSCNNNL